MVYSLLLSAVSSQGVTEVLCEACEALKWKTPTAIQREALPIAFQGGLSNTVVSDHVL